LTPIGAGVRTGWLPEPNVDQDWDLTLDEARDLAAFQAAGWEFLPELEIDWGAVRDNNAASVEAGLLMRHAWGGLVIVRNHVLFRLPPEIPLPPLGPNVGKLERVPFAKDFVDFHFRLPDRDLESKIHQQIAFIQALDGSTAAEPLVSYHVVPHGVGVSAKTTGFKQWHWDTIELRTAWNTFGFKGKNVRVAVIDRGFHPNEPEISPNVTAYVDDTGTHVPGQAIPQRRHGTLCAGLVSALDDGNGVHGAAPASSRLLIAVQSVTTQKGVAGAIALAMKGPNGNDGAHVITCSLGPTARPWELSTILQTRIDEAASARATLGIPIFWADFNANKPIPSTSVENYGGIVCVGHTDRLDVAAPCGNGPGLDLMAPGVGVATIIRNGANVMVGLSYGASVAAPSAAGVAALILSMRPGLTARQVIEAVLKGCDPPPQPGQPKIRIDDVRGWGRLNALRAMQIASTL